MASQWHDDRLVDKVDELAASLHATTDVLSTADRMLGHYRDLNKEQDVEIARLNKELVMTRPAELPRRSRGRNLPRTPSFSDLDERRPRSSKVRFTDEESTSELEEFENAIRNLNRKQDRLQKELHRDRRKRSGDLRFLADKQRQDSSDNLLEQKLSEIQQQLEHDKANKHRREDTVDKLADEIRQIRGLVQQHDNREPAMSRADMSNTRSRLEEDFERERSLRDQETISDLRRQLRQREDDQERLLSQVKRTKTQMEEGEADLQRSKIRIDDLESKAERGDQEKRKLEKELEALRTQNLRVTRENVELTAQLNLVRDKNILPDVFSTDIQRKIRDLEDQRERSAQKLSECKNDSDRKDALLERLKSQVRELTTHTEKAESDKRKYIGELEEAMKRLRDSVRNGEDLKSLLRERDDDLKNSEEKRQDLKSKALEVVKEYRSKCRDLERDKKRLQEGEDTHEDELARVRSEKQDILDENGRTEKEVKEQKKIIEQLQNDLQRQTNQMLQMGYEKAQLEEGFSNSVDTRKETARLQRELQELNAKHLATSSQLAEESAKRRDAEDRLQETKDQESTTKEEALSLYQQLQEERASHTRAMRQMEEELQSISANEERTMKELMEKTNQEKARYEEEIRLLKAQVAQERSTANANLVSHDEFKRETEKLNSELNRKIEENRKIRKRYLLLKNNLEDKIMKFEQDSFRDKDRVKELEDELRNNQENLLQTRESFKQSLHDICYLTDSILDSLILEANQTKPTKSISDSMLLDPKKWSIEIQEKLRNCSNLLNETKERNSKLKHQFSKAQEKIEELLGSCDQDKKYFLNELDKQNELIEDLKREKKQWDKRLTEKKRAIQKFQARVDELTKHLEQCTKVLHSSIEALGDREKILDELDNLKDEHMKKSRLHEKYIRHEERIGNLHEKLEDAKIALQGVQDENHDATMFSLKFLKSLSPAPKRHFEENYTVKSRRLPNDLMDENIFQSPPRRLLSSDLDETPSPPKRSKDIFPMTLSDREFNDSFIPRRE